MALVMAGGIAFALVAGRIQYVGRRVIDRQNDAALFWTHLAAWAVVGIGLALSAVL
nr:hypothetical protein [Sphingomonas melonis]